ncbi:MAG: hypothetical protein OEL77_02380 [Nitrosopumilus sp.]|nr:hypothetical protein [Nitrosopumilus sp.]MDH3384842.1 hypothetical protein [Nitrosopumilus sp.]
MQEIAIILSSLAGVATAAAVRRAPRNKSQLLSIGASSHIKSQINTLKIEKDILTKTISRLYQYDSDIPKIQRDKLLLKYQHQLGIILAKLEKLEIASKHPDLGPVGDGLITLMDQKLSKLDERLYELSSKISNANISIPEIKKEVKAKTEDSESQTENKPKKNIFNFEKPIKEQDKQIVIPPAKSRQSFELTTLTKFSNEEPKFQLFEKHNQTKQEIVNEVLPSKPTIQEKVEIAQSIPVPKPIVEIEAKPDLAKEVEKITKFKALGFIQNEKPTSSVNVEDDFDEDDTDDLEKIKGEIMNVLSKLDQAEVE